MDIRQQILAADMKMMREEAMLCSMAAEIVGGLVIGKTDDKKTPDEEMDELASVAVDLASRIRDRVRDKMSLAKRNGGGG